MIPSVNQWLFPADMPTAQAISKAHEHGFQAFEVCIGETTQIPLDCSQADAVAIRKHADSLGVKLQTVGSGMGWDYPLSSPDRATREKGVEITARCLEITHWLGAEALLTVPGVVSEEVPYDEALENALSSVRQLAPEAEKQRVAVGIENVWNQFLLSPMEFRDFIDECESEYVSAYFDVGNILAYGFPEQWIRILNRRIKAVHMKDYRREVGSLAGFVMLMEGDVAWPPVMEALRAIGYDGPVTAEYPAYTHGLDVTLEHLKAALDAIVRL